MTMIIVMGLPGAGKTTVLNNFKKQESEYVILNYGDMMMEIAQKENWVKIRDEIRKLPIEKQRKAQKLVAEHLAGRKNRIILDTHCAVNTPDGYYPGLPFEFLKGLKIKKLIYITAEIPEIAARRKNDLTRVRDSDNAGEHDFMNRCYLAAYSAFTGAPALIIYNRQGKLDETVAAFGRIVRD